MEVSLPDLELLLNEFFFGSISGSRRCEIESMLSNVEKHKNAWQLALKILENVDNPQLAMFALKILQGVIERKWIALEAEQKSQIRRHLSNLLPFWIGHRVNYLTNKSINLVAKIGCLDWPHYYPDYFDTIRNYLQYPQYCLLGLGLLQSTAEELISTSVCLTSLYVKMDPQRNLVIQELADSVDAITEILDAVLQEYQREFQCLGFVVDLTNFSCSFANFRQTLRSLSKLPRLNEVAETTALQALSCLAHLVQVLSVDSFYNDEDGGVLRYLCLYTYAGIQFESAGSISIAALNCLFELLPRPCPTLGVAKTVYQCVVFMLQDALQGRLSVLENDDYRKFLVRIMEFLQLFVQYSFHRLEGSADVHAEEFFGLLRLFAFSQKSHEVYISSVDAWCLILDYLSARKDVKRYETIICELINDVVKMAISSSLMQGSDGDDFDDDGDEHPNEMNRCLSKTLMLFLKAAEFLPDEALRTVASVFDAHLRSFMSMSSVPSFHDASCTVMTEFEISLKLLSYCAGFFINENFWPRFDMSKALVERICEALVYIRGVKASVHCTESSALCSLFSQMLLCMKTYCHWLAQYYAEAQRRGDMNEGVSAIVSTGIDVCVPLLAKDVPHTLVHASISALYSLLTTVRPHYILHMASVEKLFSDASKLTFLEYPPQLCNLVHSTLACYLLMPWYCAVDCEQEWSVRKKMYLQLMNQLVQPFVSLGQSCDMGVAIDWNSASPCIHQLVPFLVELLAALAGESAKTKHICYSALKGVASTVLCLLPKSLQQLDCLVSLLSVLLSMFKTLKIQLGVEYIQKSVQILMFISNQQAMDEVLRYEHSAGSKAFEHLLRILIVIAQDPSKQFSQFIPNILELALLHIKPLLTDATAVDLKLAFYELLSTVLDVRWRYFFPSSLRGTNSAEDTKEAVPQLEAWYQCMMAIHASLTDVNFDVVKNAIAVLSRLNDSWMLFSKDAFQERLFPQFVCILLTLLADGPQLLSDAFCETLSVMVLANDQNRQIFYGTLLGHYLQSAARINAMQASELGAKMIEERHAPAMQSQLKSMIQQIFVFRVCNAAVS